MILTGNQINKEWVNNKIVIKPFNKDNITTNSYDLTLGDTLIKYTDSVIDPKLESNITNITIPEEGYLLKKGEFVLGSSAEVIGSNFYVPLIHAKSGIARLGLFVHVTADLFDIGAITCTTFQMYASQPIKLYKGMKLAQVTYWKTMGDIKLYNGKYQSLEGPIQSKISADFIKG
ncbi:hypothetical protein MOB65_19650 [Bacillus inaquosorum]|uniref:dCTP deaminase n=1 Tax=Bacillus inaquosorum TaxID=483913 RepID=UPI00227F57C6|nr:hypothetical protein [Bacillus inaquosorum]MCY7911078.1 hypothetical protein [Bacillus inaquosorum]